MKGVLYALAAFTAWGAMPLYWKQVKHVPAVELLSHRIVWALVVTVLLLWYYGRLRELLPAARDKATLRWFLPCALLIGANWGLYIWAVNNDHVLESSLGYFINPLISVLFGMLFLKERLRPAQVVALLLALAGVVNLTLGVGSFPWIAMGLATTFAVYGLLRKMARFDSLLGLTLESLVLFPVALFYLSHLQASGAGALGRYDLTTDAYLVGAGIATALPLIWFAHAARLLPLSTVGLLQYLSPTCQFLIAVFVYKEAFGSAQLLSFSLIWAALIIYTSESLWRIAAQRQRA